MPEVSALIGLLGAEDDDEATHLCLFLREDDTENWSEEAEAAMDHLRTQAEAVPAELGQALLLVIAFSMLLTPVLFIVYEHVSKSLVDPTPTTPHDDIDEKQPVIIAGIGRFGQVVNRMMQMAQVRTVVLRRALRGGGRCQVVVCWRLQIR